MGELLRQRLSLNSRLRNGEGCAWCGPQHGIELPTAKTAVANPFEAFMQIHRHVRTGGSDASVRDHGMLTQMCGNNFMVRSRPRCGERAEVEEFVVALRNVVEEMHTSRHSGREALGLAGA